MTDLTDNLPPGKMPLERLRAEDLLGVLAFDLDGLKTLAESRAELERLVSVAGGRVLSPSWIVAGLAMRGYEGRDKRLTGPRLERAALDAWARKRMRPLAPRYVENGADKTKRYALRWDAKRRRALLVNAPKETDWSF